MKIVKPTEADLAGLVVEATESQTLTQWRERYLSMLDDFFTRNSLRYRAYGPWWWLVKKEMIAAGNFEFGEEFDAEWVEALDYGRIELNLLAAQGYADWKVETGGMHEPLHTLEMEDGEFFDYLLTDTDMEIRAIADTLGG